MTTTKPTTPHLRTPENCSTSKLEAIAAEFARPESTSDAFAAYAARTELLARSIDPEQTIMEQLGTVKELQEELETVRENYMASEAHNNRMIGDNADLHREIENLTAERDLLQKELDALEK